MAPAKEVAMTDEPLAHPVWGRSGLTDAERSVLAYVTLRHVAAELHISDQEAADLSTPTPRTASPTSSATAAWCR
jgi:hypothetical protein